MNSEICGGEWGYAEMGLDGAGWDREKRVGKYEKCVNNPKGILTFVDLVEYQRVFNGFNQNFKNSFENICTALKFVITLQPQTRKRHGNQDLKISVETESRGD